MIFLELLVNLLLTMAVECGLTLIFSKDRAQLLGCALGNVLTNPALNLLLWLVVMYAGVAWYYPALAMLELLAVLLEGLVYRGVTRMPLPRALLISFGLNAASFTIGLILK